jgi:Flp pilus assembly protein TadD
VLSAHGQIQSATEEYRRAIQLNPEAYEAHLSLGQILARGGNKAEAQEQIAIAARSPDPQIRQAAEAALR